jgi:endonuclease III
MNSKSALIKKINSLLIKRFGMPVRQDKLPDPLEMLIATILSQNTNDRNSYTAYQNLKNNYKNWREALHAKQSEIEKLISTAGLAKQKSAAIINVLKNLDDKNDFELNSIKNIDDEKAVQELISYKGVGVKTASCVLLFALGRNVCPVDTHVHRTCNRIGVVQETTPDKTFFALNINFPDGIAHSFHTNLIRLGREICTSQNPKCGACPLVRICKYPLKEMNNKQAAAKRDFMLLDNVKV